MKPMQVGERLQWLREIAARKGARPGELRIVTSSLSWIFRPLDRDRGLRGRILAPLQELSDYLNQFAELGIHELLITRLGADRTLEHFMDRFGQGSAAASQVAAHVTLSAPERPSILRGRFGPARCRS